MADFEDKTLGPIFPTRTGEPIGGSNERRMLNTVGGAAGIRTREVTMPDGKTVLLRTRNGFPEFVTSSEGGEPLEGWPRGLVAYSFSALNGSEYAWSKPCLLEFNATASSWKTTYYDPPQTSKAILPLTAKTDLAVWYWTDTRGRTSLYCADRLFFGLGVSTSAKNKKYSGKVKLYDRWQQSNLKFGVDTSFPIVPFVSSAVVGEEVVTRFLIHQSTEHTYLTKLDGANLYDHHGVKTYMDGDKAYDAQLPPAVTPDGSQIALQSCVDHKFGVPGPGAYDLVTEKYYLASSIQLPAVAVQIDEFTLPTHVYGSGVHYANSGNDTSVGEVGSCGGNALIVTGPGFDAGFVLHCSMANPPYDMTHFMPAHQPMDLVSYTDSASTGKAHAYRDDSYSLSTTESSQIGRVALSTLVPVVVSTACNIDRQIHANGAMGSGATTFVPGTTGTVYCGEVSKSEKQITVTNTAADSISISASAGGLSVVVFEHTASASGTGSVRVADTWSGFRGGSSGAYYWEGYPGPYTTRNGGQAGDGIGTEPDGASFGPPCYGAYVIFEGTKYYDTGCVSALLSKPAFFDQLAVGEYCDVSYGAEGSANAVYDLHKESTNTKSPYAGAANFSAKSRTIMAFDAQLGFAAYIEAEVGAAVSYSVSAWDIGLISPVLNATHTVRFSFVVEYRGVKHSVTLLDHPVTKIGPWDRPEFEDWSQWPWTGMAEIPGQKFVQPPLVFPDATKVQNIDNVFLHQGVCLDLAGIPESESPNGGVIYSKRFKLSGVNATWLLSEYLVNECMRGANESSTAEELAPYYYCPELKPLVEDTIYQVEFDSTGLRLWADVMRSRVDGVEQALPPDRDSVCYRV